MFIQTWKPSVLLSILFLYHNGSNCGSASLQILNLSGFQCSFRRLFYSAIFFYTFVYEATKRERAGEWEVRRPRFTLGAKFILCGDKIYFSWPFLLSRPRYSSDLLIPLPASFQAPRRLSLHHRPVHPGR